MIMFPGSIRNVLDVYPYQRFFQRANGLCVHHADEYAQDANYYAALPLHRLASGEIE